jgi:SNF2 family DNA or RNA helicase
VEWLAGHGGAFVLLRPGKGKTAIVLRAVLALKDAGMRPRALVVAPLRVATQVWPDEPGEWAGSEWARLSGLKIRVLHGPKKDWEAEQDADIYVINPDGLKWLFEDGQYARFQRMRLDTLVWDESTKIKHTRTKRFKLLKPTLKTFTRRWPLTGSPIPRSYLDFFGQLYVVDLGRALGQYITHYRMEYFTPRDRFGWEWDLKPGSEQRIQAAIAPYVFQLTEAEERAGAKEPELVENVVRVELPAKARKLYDEMEEELIVELGRKTVVAVSSGVAAMKCGQIANGGLYHDREPGVKAARAWSDLHEAKLEAVEEIVDELQGRPAMVVYEFEHDLARLRGLYPKAPWIGGGVSAGESARILAAWNRSEYPVLLVQPQTVSHGINAQYGDAQDIIWHSLIYDYEIFDQLIKRLLRQGSRHTKIYNHLIVARGTVDEAKLRSLRRKERAQAGFLAAMKEYARERKSVKC